MIPYSRQDISRSDIDAVIDVLQSDFLTQGPVVQRFELAVGAYVGAKYGVATCNATCALHVACLALDLGPDDWLWTSPNTFVASANSALYCGAKVDFVDIDPLTYNMSAKCLAEKLEDAKLTNRLPKIVMPVHFAGQSCDMAAIYDLSQRYGFRIIEDASHAIGGKYRGEPIGNCRFSDITVFSFHPVKIITTGEGGIAMTNDPNLAEQMTRYRSHGITTNLQFMLPRSKAEIWNYQQIDLGFNYRMTDIQAALGLSQLARLDEFISRRHAIAQVYDQAIMALPVVVPLQHPDAKSSYHLYPIRVQVSRCGKTQHQVYRALHEANILCNLHYIPVYRQPYYESMGFKVGHCPEAELYYSETVSIPIYPTLTHLMQLSIINELKKVLL